MGIIACAKISCQHNIDEPNTETETQPENPSDELNPTCFGSTFIEGTYLKEIYKNDSLLFSFHYDLNGRVYSMNRYYYNKDKEEIITYILTYPFNGNNPQTVEIQSGNNTFSKSLSFLDGYLTLSQTNYNNDENNYRSNISKFKYNILNQIESNYNEFRNEIIEDLGFGIKEYSTYDSHKIDFDWEDGDLIGCEKEWYTYTSARSRISGGGDHTSSNILITYTEKLAKQYFPFFEMEYSPYAYLAWKFNEEECYIQYLLYLIGKTGKALKHLPLKISVISEDSSIKEAHYNFSYELDSIGLINRYCIVNSTGIGKEESNEYECRYIQR